MKQLAEILKSVLLLTLIFVLLELGSLIVAARTVARDADAAISVVKDCLTTQNVESVTTIKPKDEAK